MGMCPGMMGHGMTEQSAGVSGEEEPLEILKRRYARGEITRQEYEERKKVLLEDSETHRHQH